MVGASFPLRAACGRLLRDFIAHALYDPVKGYFSKRGQHPVGFLDPPIDFRALPGRISYLNELRNRYAALGVSWLTPVEIFSPHFGAAVANYVCSNLPKDYQNLKVYEIGGGTGTLAKDVLHWMQTFRPDLYKTCRYVCIEISQPLAELQRQRVWASNDAHKGVFEVVVGDAGDGRVWQELEKRAGNCGITEECTVLAMEVLDNLPHDRVVGWQGNGVYEDLIRWQETIVEERHRHGHQQYVETLRPVQDDLIRRCLMLYIQHTKEEEEQERRSIVGAFKRLAARIRLVLSQGQSETIFLPTGALHLFDTLHSVRPNHHLVAADFDFLPETIIQGLNAPLVSSTVGGQAQDRPSYLIDPGTADIFFPSDFSLLTKLYNGHNPLNRAHHCKARNFFETWAPEGEATEAMDGYNPLLSDYTNTSFLLS